MTTHHLENNSFKEVVLGSQSRVLQRKKETPRIAKKFALEITSTSQDNIRSLIQPHLPSHAPLCEDSLMNNLKQNPNTFAQNCKKLN